MSVYVWCLCYVIFTPWSVCRVLKDLEGEGLEGGIMHITQQLSYVAAVTDNPRKVLPLLRMQLDHHKTSNWIPISQKFQEKKKK